MTAAMRIRAVLLQVGIASLANLAGMENAQAARFLAILQAAEQGDADAQDEVGCMYSQGWGVAKARDPNQAFHWYSRAAEQGHAGAQRTLGQMHRLGIGVASNDIQAVAWYRRAAEQGDMEGQSLLAMMYEHGYGVAQDDAQAIFWYRKAADQGSSADEFRVHQIILRGLGERRDLEARVAARFRASAEKGDALAQNVLGDLYYEGRGIPQGFAEALYWYRQAAEQGYPLAQYNLGGMYERGRGVVQDDAVAIAWYRKAAERQSEAADRFSDNARKALERMRLNGRGNPVDPSGG